MDDILFTHIKNGATILTPNRRLAATLHKRYQQYQLMHNQTCWPTPEILPFVSWCERMWFNYTRQHFDSSPKLLNKILEPFLWERIILETYKTNQLLQISETADICRSAWSLIQQWQIDINDSIFHATEDSLALHHWLHAFLSICKKNNWIDQTSLLNLLSRLISEKKIPLPSQLIFVGFTEINPQIKTFIHHCENRKCKVESISLSNKVISIARLSFEDYEAEITAIAHFAKQTLQKNNQLTIGCVIPNLEKIRDRVAQLFADVFASSTLEPCYNISAGKPLADYPIIHSALQLLNLHRSYVYADYFSHLLTTPFLGDAESERIERAKLDVLLRKYNVNRIAIRDKLKSDSGVYHLPQYIPLLSKRLTEYYAYLDHLAPHLTYSEWADRFTEMLTILGWPGERSIDSEEYQTVEQWLALLNHLKTLDYISAPVTLTDAIASLHKMARRHIFQPKTPDAPIQVLGLLEAAGLTFDYLWVAGMDDVSWPPQPKPNPLIPKRLQRELNMPHATADRELVFSTLLTKQFQQSASFIYFSHALKSEELELQASPLIQHLPQIQFNSLVDNEEISLAEKIYFSQQKEILIDNNGPTPLTRAVRGGVNVIKQQALCPFKAFAEWRLYAKEMEKPLPGLRNKDRGTILHKVMEILWAELKCQENLLKLSSKDLKDLIAASISHALIKFPLPLTNADTYISLEKIRLENLVSDWLEVEKNRPPFTVISHEHQIQMHVNELELTLKMDRIDELENGKKLIIDYKSGNNNEVSSWLSDRPDEPQLPLYALYDTENIVAIAFAQIAAGAHKFIGISQYETHIKGIKPLESVKNVKNMTVNSWQELLTEWKRIMNELSHAFYQGQALVHPKDEQQTCMWCQLKSLCRFHEEVSV